MCVRIILLKNIIIFLKKDCTFKSSSNIIACYFLTKLKQVVVILNLKVYWKIYLLKRKNKNQSFAHRTFIALLPPLINTLSVEKMATTKIVGWFR